jgi:hypothetical protein
MGPRWKRWNKKSKVVPDNNSRSWRGRIPGQFDEVVATAAKDIASGSLFDAVGSQVGERSWRQLADINKYGMLTTDSQAGETQDERAYVCGIMPTEEAELFAARLNVQSRYVAFCVHHSDGHTSGWETIPVTTISPSQYKGTLPEPPQISKSDTLRFHTHLGMHEDSQVDDEIQDKNLSGTREEYRLVQCFDPVWGRPGHSESGLFEAMIKSLLDCPLRYADQREGEIWLGGTPAPNQIRPTFAAGLLLATLGMSVLAGAPF